MEEMTFETAMAELEKIVEELEKGNLSLERSLELYEKGIRYAVFGKNELKKAHLKLEELTAAKKTDADEPAQEQDSEAE